MGTDNGLSPCRRQAIIWTNAGLESTGTFATNFNVIGINVQPYFPQENELESVGCKISATLSWPHYVNVIAYWRIHIPLGLDEFMQNNRNSSALTMALRLF